MPIRRISLTRCLTDKTLLGGDRLMPEISRFFGIIIAMFYDDHAPPHFHVRYGEQKAIIAIDTLSILRGRLAPRAHGLVMEWAALHKEELLEDWALAEQQAPLKKIKPLE